MSERPCFSIVSNAYVKYSREIGDDRVSYEVFIAANYPEIKLSLLVELIIFTEIKLATNIILFYCNE